RKFPTAGTESAAQVAILLQAAELAQERPTTARGTVAAMPSPALTHWSQRSIYLRKNRKQRKTQDGGGESGVEAEFVGAGVDRFGAAGQSLVQHPARVELLPTERLGHGFRGRTVKLSPGRGADMLPAAREAGYIQCHFFVAKQGLGFLP